MQGAWVGVRRRRSSKADAHWGWSSINLRAYRAVKELFSPRTPAGSCQPRSQEVR